MTHVVYVANSFPVLQNQMFATAQAARSCPRGDIELVQSVETGLVYNRAFRPELVTYDASYQNEQGLSAAFSRHLDAVIDILRTRLAGASLVEVGCGKGLFLERLLTAGFDVVGFDPTYEGSNPRVHRKFFTPEAQVCADGIVLRHVLEHVADPMAFLTRLKLANGDKGRIYIEVPCLEWIAHHHAWFDIFYEHVNYFRGEDFDRMFGTVHEAGHLFSGQYLYVVADLQSLRQPRRPEEDVFNLPADFLPQFHDSRLRRIASGEVVPSAIWGGASKGVIFALLRERAGMPIDTVIDINPAKQGRFLPATGLRVESPVEAMAHLPEGADAFVMNSNYLQEIMAISERRFNYITIERSNGR